MKKRIFTLLGLFSLAILVSVSLTSCSDDDDSSPDSGNDDDDGDLSDVVWDPYKFKADTYFAYSFSIEQGDEYQMEGTAEIIIDDPAVTVKYVANGDEVESSVNNSDDISVNYQNAVTATPLGGILYQGQWITIFSDNDLEVGNSWNFDSDDGSMHFEVSGTEDIAGIEGKLIEMDLTEDGETKMIWNAVINTDLPLPLKSHIEDYRDDIIYTVELTDYQE
ncbi:MAG: hypothetical protein ACQESX_03365 [Bacteroidota bacterium]